MVKKQNAKNKLDQTKTIGEHKIIEIIKNNIDLMPKSPVPFGDDVSAVNLDQKRTAVLKIDMLVGKTDVPKKMTFYQAAHKAVVMNVSDFAAKGVQPIAALVSLGAPAGLSEKDFTEIAQGLNDAARENGAYIVGGDTSEASDLVIAVSLFGTTDKTSLMLRSGAKPGDILAVTGFFGKPAAGLHLLTSEKEEEVTLKVRKELMNSVLAPKARLAEGLALGNSGAVTASIDSSDGLAWSIHEIAKLSNVGFKLNNLPVAEEAEEFATSYHFDISQLVLYGGEEYELVVTIDPKKWATAEAAVAGVGGILLPIGKATTEKKVIFYNKGKCQTIEARGWEHFKSKA